MTFGFLAFPNVEELDLIGPWEIIGMWSKHSTGPKHRVVVSKTASRIICAKGLIIESGFSYYDCPSLDFLLVPGGQGAEAAAADNDTLDFIARNAATCKAVLSVCTGAIILAAAGLLEGKRVTTHWRSLGRLRTSSRMSIVEDRFIRDGNIWTSAGVSAGIDMALALVAEVAGMEVAARVQLDCEYFPAPNDYGARQLPEAPAYARR